MEHHRPRRYRGPGVWALVRDAYLAGEPAPKVAQRYDVGLANLRRKALAEGWTRRAHAHATDLAPSHTRGARSPPPAGRVRPAPPAPPPGFEVPPGPLTIDHLGEVLNRALSYAAHQLSEGRGAEAQATLKAIASLRALHAEMLEHLKLVRTVEALQDEDVEDEEEV